MNGAKPRRQQRDGAPGPCPARAVLAAASPPTPQHGGSRDLGHWDPPLGLRNMRGSGGKSEPGAPAPAGAACCCAVHPFCAKAAACLLVVNVGSSVSHKRHLNDQPPLSKLNLAAIKFRVSHTISAPENGL